MSKNDRFIRQTCLEQFGTAGQAKLENGRVLIVGLGGLGIPAANYLNAMGVGNIGLVEQDLVELHNLQRQVLYSENDVGKPKIEVALEKLQNQNSGTVFKTFDTFLTKDNALEIIKDFDVVVDASDNFPTRYLINDACVILGKPFVYGALHYFEGQVSVFNYNDGPTYRCLFPNPPKAEEIPNCDDNGVLGVIPGIVGTLQALETVKVLTGVGEALSGKLLLYDGLTQTTKKIGFDLKAGNKQIEILHDSYETPDCRIINSVTVGELTDLLKIEQPQIIDVRTKEEFDNYNLKGTVHIPLDELTSNLGQVNFENPVYLLCQSGQRSKQAYQKLKELKPEAILFNITGGLTNMSINAGTN